VSDLALTVSPVHVALLVYAVGVLVGLFCIDAGWPTRMALALLWPLGPVAFLVTVTTLLLASLVAFPVFGAIVLALGLAFVAFAQPLDTPQAAAPALRARFIGNMAYAITDGTTTLFTDFPYESGYSVYMEYDAAEIRSTTKESIALVTHRHRDHWDRGLFASTDWRVVAPEDALTGVPAARILRALPSEVEGKPTPVTSGPITIEALPTPHANIGHYSYLVTWHGRRLYFTGDTDCVDQLLAVKNVDIAFVSPWLFERAARAGRRIDARRVVIYHQTADEKIPECRDTCRVPKQGETLTF
jgi:L-ascorbate metabolism protein UlaG (beta-lactamase superfamily)